MPCHAFNMCEIGTLPNPVLLKKPMGQYGPCSWPVWAMQLFMWQRDIVGVAHYIMDCSVVLGALDHAPNDASISSSSALAAK